MTSPGPDAVDAYVARFPPDVQERLTRLRHVILEHLPGGEETIRYDMPAVMVGARYGLHFAGWKKHVGLYPVPTLPEGLERRVAPFRSGADSVTFPYSAPVPLDLVEEVAAAIVELRRR